MKTHRFASTAVVAFATLAVCSGAFAQNQRSATHNRPIWEEQTQPAARGRVQRVNPNAESFGMQRLAGRPVRSRNGEQLSTVTDFLVDPQSGRVHFAILPSGGGPRGMTYRIVPISAFVGADEDALILRLDRAQWDRVGTMEEAQLKARVTIDVDHQQRLGRQLALPMQEIYDGRGPAELVRATSMRGESIRSGKGEVGRITDVVIDVTRRESAIVLSLDLSFGGSAGSEQRYVVPFQHLGRKERGTWASQLRREDFPAHDHGVYAVEERARTYQPRRPREQFSDVSFAANAVKQTLDRSLGRGRVDVVPERSHLVLRGMVDNEQDRAEIERLAGRTAPGVRIENQIAVRRR